MPQPDASRHTRATSRRNLLRRDDPELADAIEAIAPILLGRAQSQEDAQAAIDAVTALFNGG